MDSGAGFIQEEEESPSQTTSQLIQQEFKNEQIEERHIERIDEAYKSIWILTTKSRAEDNNIIKGGNGYESLQELWQDFAPVVLKTIHLNSSPIQRLLNFTGDFHDFCEAFKEDTDLHEYKEYFDAMDFAWCRVLRDNTPTKTDKVRVVSILRDGQDRAALLNVHQAYEHATELADDEFDE